jgi:hypothetical protein
MAFNVRVNGQGASHNMNVKLFTEYVVVCGGPPPPSPTDKTVTKVSEYVVALSLEAVLVRGIIEEHAFTSIIPLGWLPTSTGC